VGQYPPNFHVEGDDPRNIFARIDRPMNALQDVDDIFHTKKIYSRLSSSKVRFSLENGRFASLSVLQPPSESLGATYDVHLIIFGKRVVDFLLVNFFARCYG